MITIDEMKNAICKSGYLLEQRLEAKLNAYGFYTIANDIYSDPITDKNREIDLVSRKFYFQNGMTCKIHLYISMECKNNSVPIVFFENTQIPEIFHNSYIKYSGLPQLIYSPKKTQARLIDDFLRFSKIKNKINTPICSQYCSFHKKNNNSNYIALHQEEHNDAFNKLIDYIIFKRNRHHQILKNQLKQKHTFIDLSFYLSALIFQGDIYISSVNSQDLELNKIDHILFRRNTIDNNESDMYLIDVMTESYFNKYVNKLEKIFKQIVERCMKDYKKVFSSAKVIKSDLCKILDTDNEINGYDLFCNY